jgi:RNA polymerase sigma factor, sigma-70 family
MEELYKQYKPLLFSLAYQMTGSVVDAEDSVQDVFTKACDAQVERMASPKAYLCKMVTNCCVDKMRSARRRREQYYGPWLPEPFPTPEDTFENVVRRDMLSYAMLILLERLTPAERAVFILHEAIGFDYRDIAEILEKSETNCRKLLSRARSKMKLTGEEKAASSAAGEKWVRHFVDALEHGSIDTILSLLAEDITIVSDGGGKVAALARPIASRDQAARFLAGLVHAMRERPGRYRIDLAALNGQTALVVRLGDEPDTVAYLYLREDRLAEIYFMRNPDKLARI